MGSRHLKMNEPLKCKYGIMTQSVIISHPDTVFKLMKGLTKSMCFVSWGMNSIENGH